MGRFSQIIAEAETNTKTQPKTSTQSTGRFAKVIAEAENLQNKNVSYNKESVLADPKGGAIEKLPQTIDLDNSVDTAVSKVLEKAPKYSVLNKVKETLKKASNSSNPIIRGVAETVSDPLTSVKGGMALPGNIVKQYLVKPKNVKQAEIVKEFDEFRNLKAKATPNEKGELVLPKKTGKETVKELVDTGGAKAIPFLSGMVDIKQGAEVANAYSRLKNGKANEYDIMMLSNFVDKSSREGNRSADVINTVAGSLAFGGELLATAGIGAGVKAGAVKGTKKVLEEILTKEGASLIKKKTAELLLKKEIAPKLAGGIAQEAIRAPIAGAFRTGASTINHMLPQIDWSSIEETEAGKYQANVTKEGDGVGLALAKGLGETYVETLSERAGDLFGLIGGGKVIKDIAAKTALGNAFIKANAKLGAKESVKAFNKLVKQAGWNGVIGEMLEEQVGGAGYEILQQLGLSDQGYQLPTKEELITQLIAFSIPGTVIGLTQTALGKFGNAGDVSKAMDDLNTDIQNAILNGEEGTLKSELVNELDFSPDQANVLIQNNKEAIELRGTELPTVQEKAVQDVQKVAEQVVQTTATKAFPQENTEQYNAIIDTIRDKFVSNKELTVDQLAQSFKERGFDSAKSKEIVQKAYNALKQDKVDFQEAKKTQAFEEIAKRLESKGLSNEQAQKQAEYVEIISGRKQDSQKLEEAIEFLANPQNQQAKDEFTNTTGYPVPDKKEFAIGFLRNYVQSTPAKEEALGYTVMRMLNSEAGYRIFKEEHDATSTEPRVIGIPSTFEQHIPENLRKMDLYKRTIPYIESGIRPPEHKSRMRELYDIIVRDIEDRAIEYQQKMDTAIEQETLAQRYIGDTDVFSLAIQKEKELSLISEAETEAIVRKYFDVDEVPVSFYKKLRTPSGLEAWGKYSNGMISFVENPKSDTPEHEVVHAFLDLFVSPEMKTAYLKTAMKDIRAVNSKELVENGIDKIYNLYRGSISRERAEMVYAEEVLAEQFINYVKGKETKTSLQRFFDSVIAFLKRIANVTDAQRLYEDIIARKRYNKNVRDQQVQTLFELNSKQYGNTTKTLSYLKKTIKKEVVNRSTIEEAMKRQGVTKADKDVLTEVLDTYQGENINLGNFIADVEAMIMPLVSIPTKTFASYGLDNNTFSSNSYGSLTASQKEQFKQNARTLVFESPFKHGSVGHFPGLYKNFGNNLSIREADNKFYVIDNDKIPVGLTGQQVENLPDFPVLDSFDTKEEAENYIKEAQNKEDVQSGLAFHIRYSVVDGEYYVVEVQSDSLQGGSYNYLNSINRMIRSDFKSFIRDQAVFKYGDLFVNRSGQYDEVINQIEGNGEINSEYTFYSPTPEETAQEIETINNFQREQNRPEIFDSYEKGIIKIKPEFVELVNNKIKELQDEAIESLEGKESRKQFDLLQKNFHERAIKEFIKHVAIQAQTQGIPDVSVNFATPLTVSIVEGHIAPDFDKDTGTVLPRKVLSLYDIIKNLENENAEYNQNTRELNKIEKDIEKAMDDSQLNNLRSRQRKYNAAVTDIKQNQAVFGYDLVSRLIYNDLQGVDTSEYRQNYVNYILADEAGGDGSILVDNTDLDISSGKHFKNNGYMYEKNNSLDSSIITEVFPGYSILERSDVEEIPYSLVDGEITGQDLVKGDKIMYEGKEHIVLETSSTDITVAPSDSVEEYDQEAMLENEVKFVFETIADEISTITTVEEAKAKLETENFTGPTARVVEDYIEQNGEKSIQEVFQDLKDDISSDVADYFEPYIDGRFFSTDYYGNTGYIVQENDIFKLNQPYQYAYDITDVSKLDFDDTARLMGYSPAEFAGPEDLRTTIVTETRDILDNEILPQIETEEKDIQEKINARTNELLEDNKELRDARNEINTKLETQREEISKKADEVYAEYKQSLTKDAKNKRGEYNFLYETELSGNARTVHKFYESKLIPTLAKMRDVELKTLNNGTQWWKTTVNEKESGQIEVYQTKEIKKPIDPRNPYHLPYKEAEVLYFEQRYQTVLQNQQKAKDYIKKYNELVEQAKDIPKIRTKRTPEQNKIKFELEKYKQVQDWAVKYNTFYGNPENLEKFLNPTEKDKEVFKNEWTKNVKFAISKGYDIDNETIESNPELKKASNNRERYEKGLITSFANVSEAVDYSTQDAYGFKVKRQDGKPITKEQIFEIEESMKEMENAIGPITDIVRAKDITVAHTNGKYPFLDNKGGLFHRNEYTITIGIDKIKAFSHEMAHAIDAAASNIDFKDESARKNYDPKTYLIDITEEQVKNFEELTRARGYTYSRLVDLEKIRENDFVVNFADYARQVMNQLKSLKTSPKNTTEKNREIKEMQVRISSYYDSAHEIFARFTEQYVAYKNNNNFPWGVEDFTTYANMMSYWGNKEFEALMPLYEQMLSKKLAFARSYTGTNPESIKNQESVYDQKAKEDKEVKKVVIKSTENAGIKKPVQVSLFDGLYQVKESDTLDDMFSKIYEIIEDKTMPLNAENDAIVPESYEMVEVSSPVQIIEPVVKSKESRGYSKVMETLEGDFGETLLYETINLADQAAKSEILVETDMQNAIKIAKGINNAPKDVILPAIRIAVYEKALETKDYETFKDVLMDYSLGQTRAGQEVVASKIAQVNQNDTVHFANLVIARKQKLVEDNYRPLFGKKKSVSSIVKEEKEKVKKAVGSPLSKEAIEDVQSFIDSLLCK